MRNVSRKRRNWGANKIRGKEGENSFGHVFNIRILLHRIGRGRYRRTAEPRRKDLQRQR